MDLTVTDLGTLCAILFAACSIVTNLFDTPEKPPVGAPTSARLWYTVYRLCEIGAMIGQRAKQRPEVAAQLVEAVTLARATKDAAAVAGIVESAAAALGKR